MSKYEVIITQKAKSIIKGIIQYISIQLHNEFAAQNLADLFKEKILSLDLFPKSSPLVDEEPWKQKGVRKKMVKMFVVYYFVDDINKQVNVLWVAYAKMNQIEELKKLEN